MEREKLSEMYRRMVEIRRFEERAFELFDRNLIPGTIHMYIGEEAVAVGVCSNLRKDDYITSTHRGHGHCIAKGARMDRIMAEVLGKETGYCRGKGGSMHIADFSVGMLGATGIVGAGIPIAVGAALSIRLRRTDQVAACFFGDGASNQGTFHEAINLAALWRLPVLFVCENNLYAMSTHQSRSMLIKDIADRAVGYGIPGVVVDGNDVVAVYDAAAEAVRRARRGGGPTLIECKTYRHRGHSRFDQAPYRPKEEVEEWMRRDPIPQMRSRLLDEGILTVEDVERIAREVVDQVEAAVKFAMESPYPAPEEALEDVFV